MAENGRRRQQEAEAEQRRRLREENVKRRASGPGGDRGEKEERNMMRNLGCGSLLMLVSLTVLY